MVRLRGNHYDYQFIKGGKRYNGVCEGCSTKREAEAYEKQIKDTVATATKIKDVKVLVENFRDELTGGQKILLVEAYELSLGKVHTKKASERVIAQKREVFRDFTFFMADRYPEVQMLIDVTPAMAEEYIALIRASGRYNKKLTYVRNGQQITRLAKDTPSSRTANLYLNVCKEVFSLLGRDAGITDNPFAISKAESDEENREAFSETELRKIYKHLDDFTGPLFTIAIMTALREGDICTLRWNNIDFDDRLIRRVLNKTNRKVEIPLTDDLFNYLSKLKTAAKDSEFVLPEHAKMYLKNRSGVTYRVKSFLEGLKIKTTRIPKGRTRAVSVKDLHSCRHTFCYYAGMRGIPLAVVQSIVGHMTPEMTKHYSAHATLEDKRRGMAVMSELMKLPMSAEPVVIDAENSETHCEPERTELLELIKALSIEKVRELLKSLKG